MLAPPSKNNAEERGKKCKTYSSRSLQKRELVVKFQSHERLGNLLQCFHESATNWEISSKVLLSTTPIRRIWQDFPLEGEKDHLLSHARSELTKPISASVNYNDKRKSKDWRYRRDNTDMLIVDAKSSSTRIIYERKSSPKYYNPKCTKWEK